MPQFKNRMWDGKIRLFSPATGEIYLGLLPYIKKFCASNAIPYIIEEGVENDKHLHDKSTRGFI